MGHVGYEGVAHIRELADNRSPEAIMMEREGECCPDCGHTFKRRKPRLPEWITAELLALVRSNAALLHVVFLRMNQPELSERELAVAAKISIGSVNNYLHAAAAAAPGLRNMLLRGAKREKRSSEKSLKPGGN